MPDFIRQGVFVAKKALKAPSYEVLPLKPQVAAQLPSYDRVFGSETTPVVASYEVPTAKPQVEGQPTSYDRVFWSRMRPKAPVV